ncbi:MAG: 2-hydroxyacyl-CoA dehydratase [Syntrophorhabdaceae bacterium]|nr:2-hydroxyacyl-CoA dehydratase [Syntrophorhabdaceae bacterium]
MNSKKIIGFTTTIPVEIIFAGGYMPCDLNNIFITDEEPMKFIEKAEKDGFPKSMCNWIKGIYGVVMEKNIDTVIMVMEGDCSNTKALAEILEFKGINIIPFSFPFDKDRDVLKREMEKLTEALKVDKETLISTEKEIVRVRKILQEIDELTWKENIVNGYENHLWLVRSSDMLGDYKKYKEMAISFIDEVKIRKKIDGVRIGFIGIPPIITDIYQFLHSIGAHVVYNEIQRQFSLPFDTDDIVERYLRYTYPYDIFSRIYDIKEEIKRRDIKGIIHYVQAFCFRVMEDVILRETLNCPILTIEGELPRQLDTRQKLRLEAFIEMLTEMDN